MKYDHYSMYNVAHHPFFDQDNGRLIYFEGTYTREFSDAPAATPRYNYNQLMYRLDLADPRLILPVAVYRVGARYLLREALERDKLWGKVESIPFFAFAPDRHPQGSIAIYQGGAGGLQLSGEAPLFFAMPMHSTSPSLIDLPSDRPGGRVWKNPSANLAIDAAARSPGP